MKWRILGRGARPDDNLGARIRRGSPLFWVLAVLSFMAAGQSLPAVAATKLPSQMVSEVAELWMGSFDNHRHVYANMAYGGPAAPELTREKREMVVYRLDAPQLGDTVLYYEEFRDTAPGSAHRQRVVSLVWDPKTERVRAQQLFFKAGPTYDRKPLDPEAVAKMSKGDFLRMGRCDLFFRWDASNGRYHGVMLPRSCVYEHVVDGMVHAEFDMFLWPDQGQLWYRDRSIRLSNGTVRGEIDGFSYLRFDRREP